MSYSVKWVTENLGITRDMLRYYEDKELLSRNASRNQSNKYREYTDEDIEIIWSIKLLIGIGFSTKEVYALMHDPDFDFDMAIAQKVAELERKHDENVISLEFAKSIKLMGRVPTTSSIGSIRFEDFLASARETWNFYDDPRTAPFMKAADTLFSREPEEWRAEDVERIQNMLKDSNSMAHAYTLHGYYQLISDMQELGYKSDTVQRVVRLYHAYMVEHNTEPELDGKITPQFIAKYTAPFFLEGDASVQYERTFGKAGCKFIAQALAFFGGYNIDEL